MKINILGSKWEILERKLEEDPLLKDCDGYCDFTIRTIVVRREIAGGTLSDMNAYVRKVKRHEIVHAFLFESGLAHAACPVEAWAVNEEMIDWFARQGEKIFAAWKAAKVLEGESK